MGKLRLLELQLLIMISANTVTLAQDSARIRYERVYDTLYTYLQSPSAGTFKNAVFYTEAAYLDNFQAKEQFDNQIDLLTVLARGWAKFNPETRYHYSDSSNIHYNFAIYKLLKDTIKITTSTGKEFHTSPYSYDFNDFFGEGEWRNMFVSKLLVTHKGNCHSLPYLYKILADELGATCWLALAPNHTYIANRCKKFGWYNTELTSGGFPIDAWIMASGYVTVEAIQNGIYMDTLSNQESIALCMLDLAKGYEHKTRDYYDGFIIKCCDLSLQFFPKNVQAMLLKAETLKRIYERQVKVKNPGRKATYQEMEDLYVKLFNLGYREMPEKMYMDWLQSVVKERNKYENKLVHEVTQGK